MLLTKSIEIFINRINTKDYYSRLGYNTETNKININAEDLIKTSHYIVDVKCDLCEKEKKLPFYKYHKNISKYNLYTCSNKCAQIKNKLTSIERYGVEHYSKTKEHIEYLKLNNNKKDKSKYEDRKCKMCDNKFNIRILEERLTCSKDCYLIMIKSSEYKELISIKTKEGVYRKYGVYNNFQRKDIIDKIRQIRIINGRETPNKNLSDWQIYKKFVRNLTMLNKKKLFNIWDGTDYYDNNHIKDYLKLEHTNTNYPTVDHKMSVLNCFLSKISAEKASDIENLCITKRIINSTKGSRNEEEFKNSLL